MKKVSISCAICGTKKYDHLYAIKRFEIVKCSHCHLVYAIPIPSPRQISNLYQNYEYENGFNFENWIRRDAVRVLNNFAGMGVSKGRMIDIGCGPGFFLDEARKKGWNTFGIDSSLELINHANQNFGVHAKRKDFTNYKTSIKYDAAVLIQVIEHYPNPFPLLRKAKSLLKKDGYLCVATPNIDSILSKVLKENFQYLIPPEHLLFFSPKTLQRALEEVGFKVVKVTTYGYPEDFGTIYRQLRSVKNKKIQNNPKALSTSKLPSSNFNKIKHNFFENFIREASYPLLNIRLGGSMIEVYCKK